MEIPKLSIEERKQGQSDQVVIKQTVKIQDISSFEYSPEIWDASRSIYIQTLEEKTQEEIKQIKQYYMICDDENLEKKNAKTQGYRLAFKIYKVNNLFQTSGATLINIYANLQESTDKDIKIYPSVTANGFFDAFYMAYALHGNLILSPDDIWLQIAMQFSEFVNQNAEESRNLFVDHQGQKELTVVYNDNDPEGYKKKNFNWDYFTKEFSKEIEKNTKVDIRQTIQSNFSTSGIIEKAAAEITLMRTMEPYFKYKMIKGCGIGSVHFRGTKEDWQLLQEKTINLKKLGMDKQWINAILEIEKEFMNTYEGKVNLDFWNKGLHSGQIAGPSGHMKKSGFTGWLKHFFYHDIHKRQVGLEPEYVLDINKIIKSVIYTPVLLIDLNLKTETHLRFLAGFEGYAEIGKLNFRPIQKIGFAEIDLSEIKK